MLNNVLRFLQASPSFREAFDAQETGVTALYEMAEGQRPFFAAALARKTGRIRAIGRFGPERRRNNASSTFYGPPARPGFSS